MLQIHSIETFGTQDGPGIRLVIFLQGCNFNCIYCHNPDTQNIVSPFSCQPRTGDPSGSSLNPQKSSSSKTLSLTKLLTLIKKQRPYFGKKGGLTFTGGEPLLQAKQITEAISYIKEQESQTRTGEPGGSPSPNKLHSNSSNLIPSIALDTNGSILNDTTKKLYNQVDLVLLDIKHIDPDWHQKITGRSNATPLKTAEYLKGINKPMWLRYVLVPGYTDEPKHLEQWAKHFQNYKTIQKVEILPFHQLGKHKYESLGIDYQLEDVHPPTANQKHQALKIFEKYLDNVELK